MNHIDGDKRNNRVGNLEYVTPKANVQHAEKFGLRHSAGEQSSAAILTATTAAEISKQIGMRRQVDIARDFGVSQQTVSMIATKRHWSARMSL